MLLIDAGNTRCKWVYVANGIWMRYGVENYAQLDSLRETFAALPNPKKILISNVAGATVEHNLREICSVMRIPMRFICSQTEQCGVKNGYQQASQLGSDRWAALIAARQLASSACLVVNCGTATTVDALTETGEFLGGLILPGIALMQHSLCTHTAQLEWAEGKLQTFPNNSTNAIYSGALQATLGAIRQQAAALNTSKILLSGGAADNIYPHLGASCEFVDNLVLRGLEIIGQE